MPPFPGSIRTTFLQSFLRYGARCAAERKEFRVSEPFDSGHSIHAKQGAQQSKMLIAAGAAASGTGWMSPLGVPDWLLRKTGACGWCTRTKSKSFGRIKTIEPAELRLPAEKMRMPFPGRQPGGAGTGRAGKISGPKKMCEP